MIYTSPENYSRETFFYHLSDICYELGVATPVLLKSHFSNFEEFNNMKFLKRDFVESFNFDQMVIENALI